MHDAVPGQNSQPDAEAKEEENILGGQRVVAQEIPEWIDVPNGEQAPTTPLQNRFDNLPGSASAPLLQPSGSSDVDVDPEYSPTTPASEAGAPEDVEMDEFVGLLAKEEQEEVGECNREIMKVVKGLGGNGRSYIRERRSAVNRIIAEVYSGPRVTSAAKLLPHLGLLPGFALDLTTNGDDGEPWDFTLEEHRRRARVKVDEVEPYMLVGSPACAPYSTWQ